MRVIIPPRLPVKAAAGRNINFTPDQWFDPFFLGSFIKFNGAKHNSMICNGYRRHAKGMGPVDNGADPCGTIQQAVFGMAMKVDKQYFPSIKNI
jgi:hypothetical protein